MKYVVQEELSLLEALSKLAPECSKTSLKSWLKEGRITVDGKIERSGSMPVHKGQSIALGSRSRYIEGDLRIYYEDKHVVVIEKPSGLLSVSTDFIKDETAHTFLKKYYRTQQVSVVHRLDQDTSGVMLFALNEEACSRLKDDFELHLIERGYTAVVEGYLSPSTGTWRSYLYEDANFVVHSTENPKEGREAITHYQVLSCAKKRSLIQLKLETGRKNQIRVHCMDAGHPIVGDKKYGAKSNPIKRLCLHAHHLAFTHPFTKQKMRFDSIVPESFSQLVQ